MECEDVALVEERNGILCAALADGASCAIHGRKGADLACRAAVDYMLYPGRFNQLFYETEQSNAKLEILVYIRAYMSQYIQTDDNLNSLEDYDTTISALCLDNDGNYLYLQLGDAMAFIADACTAKLLCGRTHEVIKNTTDLISGSQFASRSRLFRGRCLQKDTTFFLATDGALDVVSENGLKCASGIDELIRAFRCVELEQALIRSKPVDDFSFIVIQRSI